MFLLAVGVAADAAELKVLSAAGMQAVMEDLGPKFEHASGHKLTIAFATGSATVVRAGGGEPADVVIAPHSMVARLVKEGKVAADAVTAIASTGISLAIRKGAPTPFHAERRPGHNAT